MKRVWILGATLLSLFICASAHADARSDVLERIAEVRADITQSTDVHREDLQNALQSLSAWYDTFATGEDFDETDISILSDMREIPKEFSEFKLDLVTAYTELKKTLNSTSSRHLSDLEDLKDTVTFGYSTLTLDQKNSFESDISDIIQDFNNFDAGFSDSITEYTQEHEERFDASKKDVLDAVEGNQDDLTALRDIIQAYRELQGTFENLGAASPDFSEDDRTRIEGNYLSLKSKKERYVARLRANLESGRDASLTQVPLLTEAVQDINVYIDKQIQIFEGNLDVYLEALDKLFYAISQWENYKKSGLSSIRSQIYTSEGALRFGPLLEDAHILDELGAAKKGIEDIMATYTEFSDADTLSALLEGSSEISNNFSNYYKTELDTYQQNTENFISYKASELQEKIRRAKEILWLKEALLKKELDDSVLLSKKQQLVKSFISDVQQFDDTQEIRTEAQKLIYTYEARISEIELDFLRPKVTGADSLEDAINTQLQLIYSRFASEWKFDVFMEKLRSANGKINTMLQTTDLSSRTRFILLSLKKTIVEFLQQSNI